MQRTHVLNIALAACVALVACLSGCKSDDARPITSVEELDKRLNEIYSTSDFPGFSVAIVSKEQIIYQQAFGYADLENQRPFTLQTIQPLGSVSKTCIGLALLKAIEQGHFTLDTPINDILPFPVVNPFSPATPIRVKHLVTHTSGIADRESAYEEAYVFEKIPRTSLRDFLQDYLSTNGKRYHRENFVASEAGTAYQYTNIGSALAAYLIEVKTGASFSDYTRQEIFTPLQMHDTHWFYDEAKSASYATLYNASKEPYPVYSLITYPDGAMKSSAADMEKYLMEMLRGYARESDLLTGESFTTLFSPQFTADNMPINVPANEPNRGVFWAFSRSGRIAHSGGDPGLSAFVSFHPQTQIGRLILLNTEIEESEEMTRQFSSIVEALQNFESHLK